SLEDPMQASRLLWTASLCTSLLAAPVSLCAQAPTAQDAAAIRSEIDRIKAEFAARIAALEAQLPAAPAVAEPTTPPGQPAPPEAPAAAVPTAPVPAGNDAAGGTLPVYGNAASSSKVFNPDIAVIGNFLGAAGEN